MRSIYVFPVLIILTTVLLTNSSEDLLRKASIYYTSSTKTYTVDEKVFDLNAVATAKYNPSLKTKGWDELSIQTNQIYNDDIQAYAAGYLEGYLTVIRIWDHYRNMNSVFWKLFNLKEMPAAVKDFFKEQQQFIYDSYNQNEKDPYWANAYYLQKQFEGLVDGYNFKKSADMSPLDKISMSSITSLGELLDIVFYKHKELRPNFSKMNTAQIFDFINVSNHCSVLIKVKEDFSDLWLGHNTWLFYSALNKIFKEYQFNFNIPIKSNHLWFSSYPATLASTDDFYITSSDLAVTETTNSNLNPELYDLLTPKSLLTWQRAMISNRLAGTAKEWVETFKLNNSGTYNDMFMVLDLKKVNTELRVIENEALQIVETIPGYTESNDVTEYLRYGYWPSYNVPFSKNIRKLSNIDKELAEHPQLKDILDYNTCARANIFRRDANQINDLEHFKRIMRSNDYAFDPLSKGDPSYAIAARSDLSPFRENTNQCMGANDAKVISINSVKGLKHKKIHIIAGPTAENQEPLVWKNNANCKNEPNFGLADVFNFNWYEYSSLLLSNK